MTAMNQHQAVVRQPAQATEVDHVTEWHPGASVHVRGKPDLQTLVVANRRPGASGAGEHRHGSAVVGCHQPHDADVPHDVVRGRVVMLGRRSTWRRGGDGGDRRQRDPGGRACDGDSGDQFAASTASLLGVWHLRLLQMFRRTPTGVGRRHAFDGVIDRPDRRGSRFREIQRKRRGVWRLSMWWETIFAGGVPMVG
jgi:hypothetical protein